MSWGRRRWSEKELERNPPTGGIGSQFCNRNTQLEDDWVKKLGSIAPIGLGFFTLTSMGFAFCLETLTSMGFAFCLETSSAGFSEGSPVPLKWLLSLLFLGSILRVSPREDQRPTL